MSPEMNKSTMCKFEIAESTNVMNLNREMFEKIIYVMDTK